MPHERPRHLLPVLLKRLRLWPILGLLGARQIGKSTLLRQQLAARIGARYVTLDRKEHRELAGRSPDLFLKTTVSGAEPLILDEVQKAPDLFDALKAAVDERRRPGRFILSGSTEFSRRTGIRESLTGRIGLTHLYPMTVAELNERPLATPWVQMAPGKGATVRDVQAWLDRGGMPGICFLRDPHERTESFEAWLETTCYRDIQQIAGARLSGELARDVLTAAAQVEHPTLAEISARLRVDARRVRRHLEALEAVFVLIRLEPHPAGVGKALYLPFDAGLAGHLGASLHARLRIWAINECLAQNEYAGKPKPRVRHYQSSGRSTVDLVVEVPGQTTAVVLSDEEAPGTYTLRPAEALLKKLPGARAVVLAPVSVTQRRGPRLQILPWAGMC